MDRKGKWLPKPKADRLFVRGGSQALSKFLRSGPHPESREPPKVGHSFSPPEFREDEGQPGIDGGRRDLPTNFHGSDRRPPEGQGALLSGPATAENQHATAAPYQRSVFLCRANLPTSPTKAHMRIGYKCTAAKLRRGRTPSGIRRVRVVQWLNERPEISERCFGSFASESALSQGGAGATGTLLALGAGAAFPSGGRTDGPQSHAAKPLPSDRHICPPLQAPGPTHSRV